MNKFEDAINNLADQIENGHLISSIDGGVGLLNTAADKIKQLEAEKDTWKDLYTDLHTLHADGHLDKSDELKVENQRLTEAIEKASNHLVGIGSAGYEEDGTFTSSPDWKCARQVIDDLQKALKGDE